MTLTSVLPCLHLDLEQTYVYFSKYFYQLEAVGGGSDAQL